MKEENRNYLKYMTITRLSEQELIDNSICLGNGDQKPCSIGVYKELIEKKQNDLLMKNQSLSKKENSDVKKDKNLQEYADNITIKLPNGKVYGTSNNGKELTIRFEYIKDIDWLEKTRNLESLCLFKTGTQDISAVAGLENLISLNLCYNSIRDITPLKRLKKLKYLYLFNNEIENIEALNELENLSILKLDDNKIQDIEPLRNFKKLEELHLTRNKIDKNEPKIKEIISELKKNNKGIKIFW